MSSKRVLEQVAPACITRDIVDFGADLGGEPLLIPNKPMLLHGNDMQVFANCMVAAHSGLGTPAIGWTIWNVANYWLSAALHCVLRRGSMYVDITPYRSSAVVPVEHVCFVPTGKEFPVEVPGSDRDMVAWLDGVTEDVRYRLLDDSPCVRRACAEMQAAVNAVEPDGACDPSVYRRHMDAAYALLHSYELRKRSCGTSKRRGRPK